MARLYITPKTETIMAKNELKGQATAAEIAVWKREHGEVYQVTVDGSTCYLKKPDRTTLKMVAAVGGSDPVRANEVLLENCWLGGDESVKTDDEKFFGVSAKLAELVTVKQAELKKL